MITNRINRICLSVMFLLIVSQCYADSKNIPFPPTQPGMVKAMTYNVRVDCILGGLHRWTNRKEFVFDILKDNAADVIALQEALYSQTQDIQQILPQYSNYAIGRNDGNQKGESCAIFFKKDRFKLTDSGTFWFSDTPSVPGSKDWGNMPPRICSWVLLRDKTTGTDFYIYNVHLDAFSQNSRKESTRLLLKKIAARKTHDPFIVMGDFNMELDNPAMEYLLNNGHQYEHNKMVDAWQLVHPGQDSKGTRRNFMGGLPGQNIDHIPVSENVKVLEVNVDRNHAKEGYASDHFPVIAKLIFENPQGNAISANYPAKTLSKSKVGNN